MLRVKAIARWIGKIMLVLLFILLLAGIIIFVITEKRLNKKYSFSETTLAIPSDSISIAKGKHLYQIRSCADCHGAKSEGSIFLNDPMLMQITAPNLTKGEGGLPGDYATRDWLRVLRHGVDKNGKSLWMMPAHESAVLSNEDLTRLIAYCKSVTAVNNKQEKLKAIGPIGRVLMVLNNVAVLPAERIDHEKPITATTPVNPTEFGKYLASGCQGCHRNDMKGGSALAPGYPSIPDISASGAPGKWTEAEFIQTFRSGKTPEGRILRNEFVPWQNMQHFSDEELKAIHTYLKSLL